MKEESSDKDKENEMCIEHKEKIMFYCRKHEKYICNVCVDDHQTNSGCTVIGIKIMEKEVKELLSKEVTGNIYIANQLKEIRSTYEELISKKKEEKKSLQIENPLKFLKINFEKEKSKHETQELNELKQLKDKNTSVLKDISKKIELLKDFKSFLEAKNTELKQNFDSKKYFHIFNAYNDQIVNKRSRGENEHIALEAIYISKSLKNESFRKEMEKIQKASEVVNEDQTNDKLLKFVNQIESEEAFKSQVIQCFPQTLYSITYYSNKLCLYNVRSMQYNFEEVFLDKEQPIQKNSLGEKEILILHPMKNQNQNKTNFGFDSIMVEGCIYFIGGEKIDPKCDTDCFVYSCSMKRTQKISPLNSPRCDHTLTNIKSSIYCVGGRWNDQFLNSVEQYDIIENQWTILQQRLSEPKSLVTLVSDEIQLKIFCIGGCLEVGISSKIEYLLLNNNGNPISKWIPLNIKISNSLFRGIMSASALLLKSMKSKDLEEEEILLFGGITSTNFNLNQGLNDNKVFKILVKNSGNVLESLKEELPQKERFNQRKPLLFYSRNKNNFEGNLVSIQTLNEAYIVGMDGILKYDGSLERFEFLDESKWEQSTF